MKKQTVIGLTGRTGSGKTTVGAFLKTKGAAVIDADAVYRSLTVPGSPCLQELADAFGKDILTAGGALNRKALFSKAMDNGVMYEKLNALTHRHTIDAIRALLKKSENRYTVVDAALLFESGFDKECDFVIGVVADEKTLISRAARRDGIEEKDVLKRLERQKSQNFLRENCDYIIENENETAKTELYKKAEAVFDAIKERRP